MYICKKCYVRFTWAILNLCVIMFEPLSTVEVAWIFSFIYLFNSKFVSYKIYLSICIFGLFMVFVCLLISKQLNQMGPLFVWDLTCPNIWKLWPVGIRNLLIKNRKIWEMLFWSCTLKKWRYGKQHLKLKFYFVRIA